MLITSATRLSRAKAKVQANTTAASLKPDRRRHRRVDLTLSGRFMRGDKSEHPCQLKNVSVSGVAIITDVEVRPGENIVVYLDEIGRLEGSVFRRAIDGFVLTLRLSENGREKLAAKLMWLANKQEMDELNRRRVGHDRRTAHEQDSEIKLFDGRSFPCSIIDVSISGAAIGTTVRPDIGSLVQIGQLRCRVVRYHDTGIAIEFAEIQSEAGLKSSFDL